jgi:hypothetical protein
MDYNWESDFVDIDADIPCKCASSKCRGLLLIASRVDRSKAKKEDFIAAHWELIERERREI